MEYSYNPDTVLNECLLSGKSNEVEESKEKGSSVGDKSLVNGDNEQKNTPQDKGEYNV